MKQLLMTVSDLFFLFLHLLIMQRCMTAFLGPGKRSYKSVIAWMGYYIFLFLTNKVFHVSPLVLITGNIILVFLISTVTARKSIKLRCVFTILICSVWMLVEVLCAMVLTVAGSL